jgi:hypothetical protein
VKVPVSDLYIPRSTSQSVTTNSTWSVESALHEVHVSGFEMDLQARRDGTAGAKEEHAGEGHPSTSTCTTGSCSTVHQGSRTLPQGQGDIMSRVTPLLSGRLLRWGKRTLVMGILNATPDSFSDGGKLLGGTTGGAQDLGHAVSVAKRMVLDGADILDVGGQSTRPGSVRVSEQEEAARVVPLIRWGRR